MQLQIVKQEQPLPAEATFEDFWTLYPRRVKKKAAQMLWDRMKPSDRVDALVALVDWRKVWMKRGELEFVPHPTTWLNGEQWTDELPTDFAQRPASHAPVIAKPDVPRGEMPESVRQAIARLKR